jgi:hypothetical protein
LHTQQLRTGEDYQTICKTVFISILNEVLFRDSKEYHHVFRLREEKQGLVLTDDL